MTQPIIIQGQENTGKTDAQTSVAELASRVRKLEEEVDGVEPPKTEEMQKIEELEEKIDKLLDSGSTEEASFQEETAPEGINVEEEALHEELEKVFKKKQIEDFKNKKIEEKPDEQELPEAKGRCQHCGEIFDNRGLASHEPSCNQKEVKEKTVSEESAPEFDTAKMIKEDLKEKEREILDRLSQTNYKSSKYLSRGFEDISRAQVKEVMRIFKELDLIKGKRGKGSKLKDLGKEVQEAEINLPEFSEEEKLDSDEYSVEEREQKVIEELENAYKPLTRSELARRIYKVPREEDIGSHNTYYGRVDAAIKGLKKDNLIQRSRERERFQTADFELTDEAKKQSRESNESVSESLEWEQVKKNAGVNDKDLDVVKLAFDKLVNQEKKQRITYHEFEQKYSGEESALRMFQKLFNNPKLIEGVRDRVCEDVDLKWKKLGEGKFGTGVKNWVILVE